MEVGSVCVFVVLVRWLMACRCCCLKRRSMYCMLPNYLRLRPLCIFCAAASHLCIQFLGASVKLVQVSKNHNQTIAFSYIVAKTQTQTITLALGLYHTITITIDSFFSIRCGKRKFAGIGLPVAHYSFLVVNPHVIH